jgi:hypothetical protein
MPTSPGSATFRNVLSVGDVILYAGMLVLLHRICRRPAASTLTPADTSPVAQQHAVTPGPVAAWQPAPAQLALAAPRPRRATRRSLGSLTPVGVGLAGFVVAVGIGSLVASRER